MSVFKRARNTGKASVVGIRSYSSFPLNPHNDMQVELTTIDQGKRPGQYKYVNGVWIPSGKAKTQTDDYLDNVQSDVQNQIDSKLDKNAKAVDANLLDGLDSTKFGIRNKSNDWTGYNLFSSNINPASPIQLYRGDGTPNLNIKFTLNDVASYFGVDKNGRLLFGSNADLATQGQEIWHSSNSNMTTVDWNMQDANVYRDLTVNGYTSLDDLQVRGDLHVNGTLTYVNTEELKIADNIMTLNSDVTGTPTENSGLEVERGTSKNVSLIWNETTKRWQMSENGIQFFNIAREGDIARTNWTAIEDKPTTIEGYGITNAAHKVHGHAKDEVGLPNVDNTSDMDKPVSTAQQIEIDTKTDIGHHHTKDEVGLNRVDNTNDLEKPVSNATQSKLNLKSDKTHNHDTNYSKLGHSHSKNDSGLDQVDNTSDKNKPVSDATQEALDLKSDKTHLHDDRYSLLGHGHTKDEVGLDRVNNTSDMAKPVSTAQQNALNLKSDKTHGHHKSEFNLGNVDNTSDANKPVSSAQQAALNLKSDKTHSHTTEEINAANVEKVNTFKQDQTFNKNVHVKGNLRVDGTVTSINSEQVTIADNIITLNYNVTGTPNENAGIEVERGTASNVSIIWDESGKRWRLKDHNAYYDILKAGDVDYRWSAVINKPTTLGGFGITDAADKVHTHTKNEVGLSNVSNTSDMAKPVSTAQKTALDLKSDKTHLHDDRYYLKAQVNTELNKKSDKTHTHNYLPLAGGILSGLTTIKGFNGTALRIGDTRQDASDIDIRIGNGTYDWKLNYHGTTGGTGGNEFQVISTNTGAGYEVDHDGNFSHINKSGVRSKIYHAGNLDLSTLGGATDDHNHDADYLGKTAKAVDSDKLDGLNSTQFARTDVADTFNENTTFNKNVEVKQVLNVGGATISKVDNCLVFEV